MLKRVSIQNFKSLKDVTLDLQKVNLLIGPNNSGKSNFLKALEYSGKNNQMNSDEINRDSLAYSHNLKNDIVIQLKFEIPQHIKDYKIFSFDYLVLDCTIHPNGFVNRFVHEQSLSESESKSLNVGNEKTFIDHFKEKIGYIVIYKPDPNKITQPGPVGTKEEIINGDVSNIIGFLDLMLGKYRKSAFSRIESDLQTCVPEFSEISLDDAEPIEEPKIPVRNKSFKRIGLTNIKQNITYWADELSEGTLYFLALLCIINQPNPPKLLLLEEPEKGIHPRRIREVMNFIFRLAEEKDVQIILTTHNEHVLDDFATRPESVFVFDKDEEGATYVRNLQKDIIEPTNERNRELGLDPIDLTTNLSENWLYGLLGGVPSIP